MFSQKVIIPMAVEVAKICRTCLGIEGKLLSIYQTKGISNIETVSDMLKELTSIPPQKYDGFPENVCLDCIREINLCYLFKLKCEHSYSIFKQILHGSPEELQVIPEVNETPITTNFKPQCDLETQTIMLAPLDNSNLVSFVQTEDETVSQLLICPNNEAKEPETSVPDLNIVEGICSGPFETATVVENMVLEEEVLYTFEDSTPVNHSELVSPDSTEVLQMDDDDSTHQLLSMLEREITNNDDDKINNAKDNLDHCDSNACENELNTNEEAALEPPILSSPKETLPPLPCEVCGKISHNQNMAHGEERPYSCKHCEETFLDKACYKLHKMRHENKPFKCDDCENSFACSEELKAHTIIHEEKFPYECSLCCSGFRHLISLKSHTRTHFRQKRCACAHCPRKFTSLLSLKTHHHSHTNEGIDIKDMNDCKLCKKLFIKTIQNPDP